MKKSNIITLSRTLKFYILITAALFIFSCEKENAEDILSVTPTVIEIPRSGGKAYFTIETNASSWQIQNPKPDVIDLTLTEGTSKNEIIIVEVAGRTLEALNETLIVTAGSAVPVEVLVTQKESEYLYELQVDEDELEFVQDDRSTKILLTSTAPEWTINNTFDWIHFSKSTGGPGDTEITIEVDEITDGKDRSATVEITAEASETILLTINQIPNMYPSYNTSPLPADMTGVESSAVELASKIKIGWNIGNTLEAIGGETAWGNPMVTEELIQLVKANGFNAIRIPCSWDKYLANTQTAEIKASWLDRVKEVVQYCADNEMYAILNIHWDGGWLENNCTPDKQMEVNAKQKAFWEQIATHLRDFDEHLIFAGANEPNVESQEQMDVLMSYHQTFVDAVRSTGGKNAYRVLVVQGPSTDIEKTQNLMSAMPDDEVADRMMAEVHYYTPYQFCLMTEDANWGKMFYYWGNGYHSSTDTERNANWGEEEDMDNLFASMKTQFVDKGIPVILGEFAVIKRTFLTGDDLQLHLDSRAYFLKCVAQKAKANGILPFYWDAGNMGENASALFNRENNTVFDQQALDALMEGINN
ncbi:cellulase family glycosylhydrolase [Carboxylicivirga linearis]|uniref:Cellulase family glycosylhydrolase n=1 Tax=Carboxylicivirga linearis TaxID=1628157 RepID=A0ABS5JXX7_9BACT|nr:cellulase family glycosylhydrolase [Carboxylicivirga linearis]MBS2099324.1 cellulase family glycosylhydrolase [Carboxylicivirga linearis]